MSESKTVEIRARVLWYNHRFQHWNECLFRNIAQAGALYSRLHRSSDCVLDQYVDDAWQCSLQSGRVPPDSFYKKDKE